MKVENYASDLVIIGAGLAGICAAIAAARLGQQVALVHNRPVLGGNSSSEIRVWVCGATAHGINRYARETGIMGELFVENQYRNPEGNPYLWDLVLMEAVRKESNIRLFLNTDVTEVEASGPEEDRSIQSVTGWMTGSERRITLTGTLFMDCTGDGLIGFLAGAKFRLGREARSEFGEEWAPEKADSITLGSTILFYTKDTGVPVKYVPPSFAKDITQTPIPLKRVIRSGDSGCHYWWIEWGGELDTVHENERIRDELWSVIYGIWDYIKNSGQFDTDTMTLEWIGSIPGKREYRRFEGDYTLKQQDILEQMPFEDRVAFGGWSIDLHPPQGMYSDERGSKHWQPDGIYHIPFRSLYSRNTRNLMFAGRNVSASHVAFGTIRVMATCAVMGEAAGTGAAFCLREGLTPREAYAGRMQDLQQLLLRQDAAVIGLRNEDPQDLARAATVTASSSMKRIAIEEPVRAVPLDADAGQLFPIGFRGIRELRLLVSAAEDGVLQAELWNTGRGENYIPHTLLVSDEVRVVRGDLQWVTVKLPYQPEQGGVNLFMIVRSNPHISLHVSDTPVTGVLSFIQGQAHAADFGESQQRQPVVEWTMKYTQRQPFCMKVEGVEDVYAAAQITNGYMRPFGGPNLWVSEPVLPGEEAWVELQWAEPARMGQIQLTWNDDVNMDLINLHHHRTPYTIMPELARDYRIEAWLDGAWQLLHRESDNRKRTLRHALGDIRADRLRVVVESTNGSPCAELYEVRVYS
ncbi:pyridine nucleotide-disulfide oxidoreductase [Paenibacillus swuensis]|uniref:Pyridine nucleotide-disulfide oxidoreductase n=1 Tax=Paenibacillus swuensis TaxID=1178515 RepID=A0A172TFZ1_9BACL|nr:FAD-dependent oxidoreductase [Paenibacillus swuensis]ANE45703.1 pyridine nucleotide-disulfide oxidoreductase [Paenibacillus swuensis]